VIVRIRKVEESDVVLGLIASISQLKAVDTTDDSVIPNLLRAYVEGIGEYVFKRVETTSEASPNVIAPTTGAGRWMMVSTHSVNNQLRLIVKASSDITTLNSNLNNHIHTTATATEAGFMSSADKSKLNGIASNANNYSHPTGDGNLHVPATANTNDKKVLKAGSTAGSMAWGSVAYSELTDVPSTFTPSAHSHAISDVTDLQTSLDAKESTANKGVANGYASLDENAKVPTNQLPDSIVGQVEYMGTYNASTNTPALPDATTVKGHYYVVSVAGEQQNIEFAIGDWVISNGLAWEKVDNSDAVTSVHGRNGNIVAQDGDYTASQITNDPYGNIQAVTVQAAINELDDEKAPVVHSHSDVTISDAGFMTAADKIKLNGIATSANNYSHPTGDGNLHVPATSTINNNKVLKAGATAGSLAWGSVAYSELTGTPSTFTPSAHTHATADVTGLDSALAGKAASVHTHVWADITDKPTTFAPSAHTHAIADITNLQTTLNGKANTSHIHSEATSSTDGFMSAADKSKLDTIAPNANNYSHPTGDGNLHVPATGTSNNNKVLKAGATAGTIAWSTFAYSDLTGIPSTFTPSAHTHLWDDITDKPTAFTPSAHTHLWADITDKPSTFAPSTHTHAIGDVTGLQAALNDKASNTHSHTDATTSASGFMSATDKTKLNDLSNYTHPTTDGNLHVPATGTSNNNKVLKAGATAGSLAWGSVAYSELTGTPSSFTPSAHTHLWADITDKPSTFAPSAHTHAIADVTGLQTALNGKAASVHTHIWADITDKPSTFAPSAHTHAIDDITGLQTALNGKESTANKGVANGYASLDENAKLSTDQLPDTILGQVSYQGTYNASTNTPLLGVTPEASSKGHYYVVSVAGTFNSVSYGVGDWIISNGNAWDKVDNTDAVTSVHGRIGAVIGQNGDYTASQITYAPYGNIQAVTVQAAINELDDEKAPVVHTHTNATTSSAGFMSNTDKTKLDNIAANANNYSHPTGDGNLHVPATSTNNNLKVLKAGATAGSIAWDSVAYSELTGIPSTFTPSAHTHAIADVTGLQTALNGKAASVHTHLWADITDKPTTFTPSAHTHAISEVTDLQATLDGKEASFTTLPTTKGGTGSGSAPLDGQVLVGGGGNYVPTFIQGGDNIEIIASMGMLSISCTYSHPTGDGNLHVPATSTTNNNKVLKAGSTAGSLAWGSVAYSELTGVPTTFQPVAHTHAIADVTGLQTTLDGKANSSHTHLWADITDKPTTFTPSAHSHAISEVTDLQTTLDGKEASFTTLPTTKGGTGASSAPENGQILVGGGGNYIPTFIQAGDNIEIIASLGMLSISCTYSHPTGDGNLHVPATSTTNNNKVLKAGTTAGSLSWGSVAYSELTGVPTTFTPSTHNHAIADVTGLQTALNGKEASFTTLGVAKGGTGLAATPTNGQLLIGNGVGYTLTTLAQGTNISITNEAGAITISSTYTYSHPTGDGNLHVPATGTSSDGRYLKAGATAGSIAWATITYSELSGIPSTFAPSAHTHSVAELTNIYITDSAVKALLEDVDSWTNAEYSGAAAAGIAGQKHYDTVYFYECVATNTWIRMQRI
jgi:hypothetical protein